MSTEPDPIPFRDAMDELRGILQKLDADDVDVDQLAALVERAATLIRVCRQRIASTEMRVEQIIAQLNEDLTGEHDPGT